MTRTFGQAPDTLARDSLAAYRHRAPAVLDAPATIDVFVQGAVLGRTIYAVVGRDGIAAVAAPSDASRAAYLFWSHPHEAERWADVLASDPRVVAIDLPGFLISTVPAMIAGGAVAGLDWTADLEAELEPAPLAAQVCEELVRDFAAIASKTRSVWMLERDGAVASLIGFDGGAVTPLWADRGLADRTVEALGDRHITAVRKPLLEVTNRYLLSSDGLKARLAPGYVHIPGAQTLSSWAFKALLNAASRPAPGAAVA